MTIIDLLSTMDIPVGCLSWSSWWWIVWVVTSILGEGWTRETITTKAPRKPGFKKKDRSNPSQMLNPLRFRNVYIMLKLDLAFEFKINCPDASENVVSSFNFQPNIYGSYLTHGSSRYEKNNGWHKHSWRNLGVNLEWQCEHRLQTKITTQVPGVFYPLVGGHWTFEWLNQAFQKGHKELPDRMKFFKELLVNQNVHFFGGFPVSYKHVLGAPGKHRKVPLFVCNSTTDVIGFKLMEINTNLLSGTWCIVFLAPPEPWKNAGFGRFEALRIWGYFTTRSWRFPRFPLGLGNFRCLDPGDLARSRSWPCNRSMCQASWGRRSGGLRSVGFFRDPQGQGTPLW